MTLPCPTLLKYLAPAELGALDVFLFQVIYFHLKHNDRNTYHVVFIWCHMTLKDNTFEWFMYSGRVTDGNLDFAKSKGVPS